MRHGTSIHFHWARVSLQVSGIGSRNIEIPVSNAAPSIRMYISHEFSHYISLVQG